MTTESASESAFKPHVDPDVVLTLREVMADEYPVLVDTFLTDSQLRLQQLKSTDKPDDVAQAAHSFKGSSGNMGATALAELCSRLEHCARQAPSCDLQVLISEIDKEFGEVKTVYENERHRFFA